MHRFTKIRNDKLDLPIKTEKIEENQQGTTLYNPI